MVPKEKKMVLASPDYVPVLTPANEIDLFDIFATLWMAKKCILATVVVFALAGAIGSFLISEKWTSQAIITPAEPQQWGVFQQMLAMPQALGVEIEASREDLFKLFLQKFQSQTLREAYLASTPLAVLATDPEPDSLKFRLKLQAATEKMTALSSNNGANSPYTSWTLSYSDSDAKSARAILDGYITYVSDIVVRETLQNIHNTVTLKTRQEKELQKLAQVRLVNKHYVDIQLLEHSLEIANAGGLKKTFHADEQNREEGVGYPLSLGAKGIAQKLAIEKSISNIELLDADYRNREYLIAQLEKLNPGDIKFQPFNYQRAPSLPLHKEGPGKALMVLMAAMVGGILACSFVLVRCAMAARQYQG